VMRIMGGRLRGRVLRCPRGNRVRPVLGRLRESLFSLLGDLDTLVVLDLFSGVGSLGLESISRGARFATFVETDGNALRALRENIRQLKLEALTCVHPGDVYDYLRQAAVEAGRFDVVFADPPYGHGDLSRLADRFDALRGMASLLVLKHSAREEMGPLPPGVEPLRVLRRGEDRITILKGGA
jgi:16S rRNA (guanine966-N2)-methyltransferase